MLTLICFEFHTTHSHTNTPAHTDCLAKGWFSGNWLLFACRKGHSIYKL